MKRSLTGKARRPRKDGELTRKRIIASATKEFSAKGFHGARVDAIARRAGVNKERLYANFGSKEGLFREALMACFREIAEEEREFLSISDADCREFPAKVLRLYFDIHRRRPWLWRLLAWENLDGGKRASSLEGVKKPILDHLRQLHKAGQASGAFSPKVSFETMMFILTAASAFYYSNERTLSKTIGLEASAAATDRLIEEILALIGA